MSDRATSKHCRMEDTCHPDPEHDWCSCRCKACEPFRAPVVATSRVSCVTPKTFDELPPVVKDWSAGVEAWGAYADKTYGECWWVTRSDGIRVQTFTPEREAAYTPFIDAWMLARGWKRKPDTCEWEAA